MRHTKIVATVGPASNSPEELDALIAAGVGDVCFFPAQCPEVFSYTLSAALDSGLPIVVAGIGALPERAAASPTARVVRWDASAREMNDALLAAAPQRAALPPGRARMRFDEYRRRYVEAIHGSVHPRREVALQARWLTPPAAEPDRRPLAFFFEDGIVCGHASSIEGLRRFAFDPDSLYAATDERVRSHVSAAVSVASRNAHHSVSLNSEPVTRYASGADAKSVTPTSAGRGPAPLRIS